MVTTRGVTDSQIISGHQWHLHLDQYVKSPVDLPANATAVDSYVLVDSKGGVKEQGRSRPGRSRPSRPPSVNLTPDQQTEVDALHINQDYAQLNTDVNALINRYRTAAGTRLQRLSVLNAMADSLANHLDDPNISQDLFGRYAFAANLIRCFVSGAMSSSGFRLSPPTTVGQLTSDQQTSFDRLNNTIIDLNQNYEHVVFRVLTALSRFERTTREEVQIYINILHTMRERLSTNRSCLDPSARNYGALYSSYSVAIDLIDSSISGAMWNSSPQTPAP